MRKNRAAYSLAVGGFLYPAYNWFAIPSRTG